MRMLLERDGPIKSEALGNHYGNVALPYVSLFFISSLSGCFKDQLYLPELHYSSLSEERRRNVGLKIHILSCNLS